MLCPTPNCKKEEISKAWCVRLTNDRLDMLIPWPSKLVSACNQERNISHYNSKQLKDLCASYLYNSMHFLHLCRHHHSFRTLCTSLWHIAMSMYLTAMTSLPYANFKICMMTINSEFSLLGPKDICTCYHTIVKH